MDRKLSASSPNGDSFLAAQGLRVALQPIIIPEDDRRYHYRNWARSYTSTPSLAFLPSTEDECVQILTLAKLEGQTVRAVGSGHSPSDLPCTTGFMIRMDKLNQVIEIDHEKQIVVVQAGLTLAELHPQLAERGLAMSIVGSISESTIAGVISTGTHGSGLEHPCISASVLALEILLANGSRVRCSRSENPELFNASLCGLGATGLILRVSLQVEKAFRLKEVRVARHIDDVIRNLPTIASAGPFVRLWWSPQTSQVSVMTAHRTLESSQSPSSWFRDTVISGHLCEFLMFIGIILPIFEFWGNYLRSYLGIPSPHTTGLLVDRSDKVFNVDCGFTQYTTEWCVPLDEAQVVLKEIKEWLEREYQDSDGVRASMPVEIRFSAKDDIWMSPGTGRVNCWIGIVKYKPYAFATPFSTLSAGFESIVRAHQGRPHWAKTHSFEPTHLRELYPRFDDFISVVRSVDPNAMFRNEYIRRHIFGETGPRVGNTVFAKSV